MVEPAPSPESFPIARLDLVAEVRQLRASPAPRGHVAKAVLHRPHLRMVLMVLRIGMRLPHHHAKSSLLIHVVEGRIIVALLDSDFELGPGEILAIEPELAHAVVAVEDSALLMTVAH